MFNISPRKMNFQTVTTSNNHELTAKLEAINRVQAIIEFNLDGTIINANQNFLTAMGYGLDEIQGKHHRMFVDPAYAQSLEYHEFWSRLGRGEYEAREYKRVAKGGREVWIQASYNPVFDKNGRPYKVVKFATDVTLQKLINADYLGQLEAIGKSQAVIQFNMDGTIISANKNFLDAVGYTLAEIKGQHHSMFVDHAYKDSADYQQFWDNLRAGKFDTREYKRLAKGGREIWIQASYNPIMDLNGKPFKVVKYASDVTAQKLASADAKGQLDAISRVQAVIQFNLDGTIIEANKNFLDTVGYSWGEIKGQHHRMFVEPGFAESLEYKQFWESLRRGEFESKVYKRLGKGGREVWIQASYNPIFDLNGKPFKVVKYATDVTELMKTIALTDETSAKMQSVAAAIEEMSASVAEIGKNMSLSKQATDNISHKIVSSSSASERLSSTMKSMESIVGLISDIASQVNLLALNATIEAARAGDAGKGFAVVAAEVKNLANQTSKATDEIAEKISAVQELSGEVAHSVQDISIAAGSVSEYVTNVAGAVEQQNAATRDISSSTQHAATAVLEISNRIRGLSKG